MNGFLKVGRWFVIPGWLGLAAAAGWAPAPWSWVSLAIIAALLVVHVAESRVAYGLAVSRGVQPGPQVLQTLVFGVFHLEPFRREASETSVVPARGQS